MLVLQPIPQKSIHGVVAQFGRRYPFYRNEHLYVAFARGSDSARILYDDSERSGTVVPNGTWAIYLVGRRDHGSLTRRFAKTTRAPRLRLDSEAR